MGDLNHRLYERVRDLMPQCPRRRDDFLHELSDENHETFIFEQSRGRNTTGHDGQTVEGDIPDKFFPPLGGKIIDRRAGNAARFKLPHHSMSTLFRAPSIAAIKLSDMHSPFAQMKNFSGCSAIQTDIAEPSQHPAAAKICSQKLLVPESVLQGQKMGFLMKKGREQFEQGLIRGCFHSNDYEVNRTYRSRVLVALEFLKMHIALCRFYLQPFSMDVIKVRSHEKMDISPGLREARTVIAAERACTDDSNAQFLRGMT